MSSIPQEGLAEIKDAHKSLDTAGAPRQIDGLPLTLAERINWLFELLELERDGE